jgi:hypothetical protein
MATRLDEGLEDFFSRRVMDESSRYDPHSSPSPLHTHTHTHIHTHTHTHTHKLATSSSSSQGRLPNNRARLAQ